MSKKETDSKFHQLSLYESWKIHSLIIKNFKRINKNPRTSILEEIKQNLENQCNLNFSLEYKQKNHDRTEKSVSEVPIRGTKSEEHKKELDENKRLTGRIC